MNLAGVWEQTTLSIIKSAVWKITEKELSTLYYFGWNIAKQGNNTFGPNKVAWVDLVKKETRNEKDFSYILGEWLLNHQNHIGRDG